MKKYIILMLLGGLFNVGCSDWINVRPENSLTYTNYFKTEQDAAALLYNIEVYLRRLSMRFTQYGELAENRYEKYEDGLPLMLDTWTPEYYIIDAANLLIDNAYRFPLPKDVIKPYLLQAYFAKAQAYFQLAKDFGEVPIILEGESYVPYPQSSVTEVLAEAEKWALKAMELPSYENLKIGTDEVVEKCKQYGSKGAAAALMAHICAWRAGVLEEPDYWSKAEVYCDTVIDGHAGYYDLAATPEDVCVEVLKGESKEGIWEMFVNRDEMNNVAFYGNARSCLSFPAISYASPGELVNYFVSKETLDEVYDAEDLRLSAYFWHPEADSIYMKYIDGKTVADTERGQDSVMSVFGNDERGHLQKFRYATYKEMDNMTRPVFSGMEQNIIRYRLADIILLRAECRARQGKVNAKDDLNRIRERAYGDNSHAFPCADDVEKGFADDIQLAIFREREKELLLEGHRYYDARRNGIGYVRKLLLAYAKLTERDIQNGALYLGINDDCFMENNLIRQNIYWNGRLQ